MKKRNNNRAQARYELTKDIFFILIGAIIAYLLSITGIIAQFTAIFGNAALASFVAGIFFTSAFTIAPATVALTNIAHAAPASTVALWGALGAMCGDLMIFFFIKDRFAEDIIHSLKPSVARHVFSSFHLGFMKWLSPVLGALIIASPLPDEFGLALMGISKTRAAVLMPVSFAMNVAAVYGLIWFAGII